MYKTSIIISVCLIAPFQAFAEKRFSSQTSLSIISTGGNSNAETYNAGTENTYKVKKRTYGLGGHYALSLSEPEEGQEEGPGDRGLVTSVRNWDIGATYTQELTLHFSAFTGLQYQGNKFSGFAQRDNFDIGGKYIFVDTEKEKVNIEIAYRYTKERRTEPNEDGKTLVFYNKANITGDIQRIRDTYTLGFWLQYLPNFSAPVDYQINFEPSFTVIMNDIFSFKVAYRGNYDNQPNIEGNKRLDWQYTTSLVAKY